MDDRFLFKIEGKHFILETELKLLNKTGWVHDKTLLSRSLLSSSNLENGPAGHSEKNFRQIEKLLNKEIQIVLLEQDKIEYYSQTQAFEKAIDLNGFLLSQVAEGTEQQKQRLEEGLFVLGNNFKDDRVHFQGVNELLQSLLGDKFWQHKGITVFSGELVWSGWFNLFILSQLLLEHGNDPGYFVLDSYGVWQKSLRDLNSEKRLLSLNKDLFKADLTYIDNSRQLSTLAKDKLKIKKDNQEKYLQMQGKRFMLFDLEQDGFYLEEKSYYLSRYLLIRNSKEAIVDAATYDRQPQLFQGQCGKIRQIVYPVRELLREKGVQFKVKPLAEISRPARLHAVLSENDTLSEVAETYGIIIKIEPPYQLYAVEGQIVVPGEVLGVRKKRGGEELITAPIAGKVSKRLLHEHSLVINNDKKKSTLTSPLSGKVSAVSKDNEIWVKTDAYSVGFSGNSKTPVSGNLLLWEGEIGGRIAGTKIPYILYLLDEQRINKDDVLFDSQNVSAVLIHDRDGVSADFLEVLEGLGLPLFFLERSSVNTDPLLERLLYYSLGKLIMLMGSRIFFPAKQLEGFASLGVTSKKSGAGLIKGDQVKFFGYQSANLYGKIEKSLAQSSFLVNAGDGIYETRAENLILLA